MGTVSGGRRRAFRSRHHAPMGQTGKLAVIFVCIALILFVFAVMLGNYLRGLVEVDQPEATDVTTSTPEIYHSKAPGGVIALGIVFGDELPPMQIEVTAESMDEDTAPAPEPIGFDSISLSLREKDKESGEMLLAYSSPICLEFAIDKVGTISLTEGIAEIKSFYGEHKKIIGTFEIAYLERTAQSREIMRAYEIALLCELVEAGIDEILLVGFGYEVEEGISFISDVYEQKGRGTVIGLALPFDYFVAPEVRSNLAEIIPKCGFLAVDLSTLEIPVLMSAESLITDRVTRSLSVCREYSIRVLLGCGNAPDCISQTQAAINAGCDNVMTALGIKKSEMENITTAE